jgi:hypothetical protein
VSVGTRQLSRVLLALSLAAATARAAPGPLGPEAFRGPPPPVPHHTGDYDLDNSWCLDCHAGAHVPQDEEPLFPSPRLRNCMQCHVSSAPFLGSGARPAPAGERADRRRDRFRQLDPSRALDPWATRPTNSPRPAQPPPLARGGGVPAERPAP